MKYKNIIVFHEVSSVQRLQDMAKLAYGFANETILVVTKPSGAAAQIGIPEIGRLAYRNNKPLIVLPDIKDAIELLKPKIVLTISDKYGEPLSIDKIAEILSNSNDTVMIIASGTETGLSKEEAYLGKPIKPPTQGDIGPIASTAILLYILEEARKRVKK